METKTEQKSTIIHLPVKAPEDKPKTRHEELMELWQQRGREKIPVVPQYERANFGFFPSRVKDYSFRDDEQ